MELVKHVQSLKNPKMMEKNVAQTIVQTQNMSRVMVNAMIALHIKELMKMEEIMF